MNWLANNDLSKYENIVFDNISELFRSMLGNMGRIGNNNMVPTMMNYQQIDFVIIDSVRFINSLNKRVVFLAWEDTDEFLKEDGQIFNKSILDMRNNILNKL